MCGTKSSNVCAKKKQNSSAGTPVLLGSKLTNMSIGMYILTGTSNNCKCRPYVSDDRPQHHHARDDPSAESGKEYLRGIHPWDTSNARRKHAMQYHARRMKKKTGSGPPQHPLNMSVIHQPATANCCRRGETHATAEAGVYSELPSLAVR